MLKTLSRSKFFIILAFAVCIVINILELFNLIPVAQNYILFFQFVTPFAILGVVIRHYRIPQEKVGKPFAYFISSIPMLIAVIGLTMIYVVEFLGGQTEKTMKIDMDFVVLTSIAAIFVMIITDKRIDNLQSRSHDEISALAEFFGIQSKNTNIENHDIKLDSRNIIHETTTYDAKWITKIATILIGIGTIIIGTAALLDQQHQTTIQEKQTEIQRQQILLENYTYSLENFPTKVSVISTNTISIKNQTYSKYSSPIILSFSSVSPHYLKLEISNIWVRYYDPCTFQTSPTISLNGTIEKFIDKGVFNANFEIPVILNSVPRKLSQEQLTDERLVSTPIFVNATVYDEQNKTEPIIYHKVIISELHMENQYIAKSPCN